MRTTVFALLLALSLHVAGKEFMKTDTLSFVFEGKKLTGLLDLPVNTKPVGLILLIPGSGETNMIEGNGYYKRLREFFVREGFACYVWDKPGCGNSEGTFNDLDIQGSAQEAIAAIEELKRLNIPGSDKIGLWGLSRGGWVCPFIIMAYPSIAFWISVSGPDAEETFGYLLERNFLVEGRSKEETQNLMKAWYSNVDIARHGGTWEENQKAMEPLRNDPFYTFMTKNNAKPTKEGYLMWQKSFLEGTNPYPVNEKTGLQVYFPGFDSVLNRINCPVLAIFGEKDSQVDWQKTLVLYKNTMGSNPRTMLTIQTFPDGNHNLFECKTGGLREKLNKVKFCDGYFESMSVWLKQKRVSN
jgi:pimeloyl-ACP methyl ester carboxylesterase